MKKFLNFFLKQVGLTAYSSKKIKYYSTEALQKLYHLDEYDVAYLRGKNDGGLKAQLIKNNQTRWLDIGCGGNFEENFSYIDTFPEALISRKDKYFRLDIINATDHELSKVGKFDLIRMQHVFEHFTPEDGLKVLQNCSKLLNPDGYVLISTPDLRKFVQFYLAGKIKENFDWALQRVEKDAPDSFFFSIFSHSIQTEKHHWCYDAEGLIYQLRRTGAFKDIKEIKLEDPLANISFTHNRPTQDVCVIAQLG